MGTDNVLKKSFLGGFKKEGVLNYVEQLQSEIIELKKEISNNSSVSDEVDALKTENENIVSEAATLTAKYDALKAENEALSERNAQLIAELEEAKKMIEEYEDKQNVFESKISSIENKFELIAKGYIRNSSADSEIISEAAETVEKAKSEVSDVNERIKTVCNNFESSAQALKSSVANLLDTLNAISDKMGNDTEKES